MNLEQMNDDELRATVLQIETELDNRIKHRRHTAMEEMKRIAAAHHLSVSFDTRGRGGNLSPSRRAGERYVHPNDPTKIYVVGQGRPPARFSDLRKNGKLG